ncbi:MAG: hypothetical protein ACRCSV_05115 [Chlamydiales bacterium]
MIQSINNFFPSIPNMISNVSNNISKVAVPVLALIALSYIPTTYAGLAEYELCMACCPTMAATAEIASMGSIPYEYALTACQLSCKLKLLF